MNMMHEQIWQDFLKIIREEVGSRVIETWIKAVHFSYYDPIRHDLAVKAPNSFVKNWVETHYKHLFVKHLKRLFGVETIQVNFFVDNNETGLKSVDHESTKIVPAIAQSVKKKRHEIIKKSASDKEFFNAQLNPAYTFEQFVVGTNNEFAYASARAVSEKLGVLYNPLLLYGLAGLGKTHLLHAIGNAALHQNPELNVLYQTADRFVSEFIYAIRNDSVLKFQNQYKKIDLFLIDDIQFLVNKEQTQEIFFHIFNSFYESNKQIVLSCDTLPRYLGGLADRLKSRLEWGLVADLQIPDFATKKNILSIKALKQASKIEDSILNYLAQQNIASVRELESLLIRILAYQSLTDKQLTLDVVEKIIVNGQDRAATTKHIDLEHIAAIIKKHYGYDVQTLRSKDRSKSICIARHVAMYLMKVNCQKSLREIGEFLDRKDHTTVTHAILRIEKMMQDDSQFASVVKKIQSEFI